jgi:hypothetical protein
MEEIGGHSSFWVRRGQIEGCSVFAANLPSEFNEKGLVVNEKSASKYLDFPV